MGDTLSIPFPGDIDSVMWTCQSISMLDRIIGDDPVYAYYTFQNSWRGIKALSMNNGCRDHFYVLFTGEGAVIKGYDNESPMSLWSEEQDKNIKWPGLLSALPKEFKFLLSIEEIGWDDTTFCFWRRYCDSTWFMDNIEAPDKKSVIQGVAGFPDGSTDLLYILDGLPETYYRWASEYWNDNYKFQIQSIEHIYAHKTLTSEIVKDLNPKLNLDEIIKDAKEIGYPNPAYKKRNHAGFHIKPFWW